MVPHLITALTGPINELEQRILDSMPAIERWFRLEWMEHTPPFYSSVDVRNAGFKLAPVDTNLFPGGWNHLTPEMMPLAVQAAMAAIEKICPEAKNLLLVPENSTDVFYLSNLRQLQRIFIRGAVELAQGLPGLDSVALVHAQRGQPPANAEAHVNGTNINVAIQGQPLLLAALIPPPAAARSNDQQQHHQDDDERFFHDPKLLCDNPCRTKSIWQVIT